MINFIDGTAQMSITELDHEFSLAKQSVISLIHRATRHGICVEHTLHDGCDLFSGGIGQSRLLSLLWSITHPGNRAIKYRGASQLVSPSVFPAMNECCGAH